MGTQLSLLAQTTPSIGISSYIDVLEEVHYISQLNSSKFLKTCKALDPNGEIIIKVFIKPTEDYKLDGVLDLVNSEALLLSQLPNVLNYSKVIESNRAVYLIRQHLHRSLYERLSSRPYLQLIEQKFIAFQLLNCLKDIHSLNVTHGDIKTENILVNSWSWVSLSDFASQIKPVYLPEDNPGEYSFYFDTSKRRICYVAPERFDSKLNELQKSKRFKVTKEMDIFSMGCCIAELFAEDDPIFNLSQLFKYKAGDYKIIEYLDAHFESDEMKNLIRDMVDLNPKKRLTASQLLDKYRGNFFPDYFYSFTYDYLRTLASLGTNIPSAGNICVHTTLKENVTVLDEAITKIYNDFPKICGSLELPLIESRNDTERDQKLFVTPEIHLLNNYSLKLQPFQNHSKVQAVNKECMIFLTSYLCHALRNIRTNDSKIKCLELLTCLSQFVSDKNKLNRIVPYLLTYFEATGNANAQALSVQCLCQVLTVIEEVDQLNENIFIDYLLPQLKKLLIRCRNEPYVRIVVANCLGNLVEIAGKFQELSLYSSATNEQDRLYLQNGADDKRRYIKRLSNIVDKLVVSLLTDNEVWVKIALLDNILPLCKFFGKERTNDIILSHLITYLNDKNPFLRMVLVEVLPAIAILLGPITLQQYILPLLIQTLTDTEEAVVTAVLQSIKDLCKTGLIETQVSYDIAMVISPLILHPNYSIRQMTLMIIYEISQKLTKAEIYCSLYPIIKEFFDFDVVFTLEVLLSSAKKPISRTILNLLCSWSSRASNSLFWQQIPNKHVDSVGNTQINFISKDYSSRSYGFNNTNSLLSKASTNVPQLFNKQEVPLTTEDKIWIEKFKTVGLADVDLWKITALRAYVTRITTNPRRRPDTSFSIDGNDKNQLSLSTFNILPRTVFFEIDFVEERTQQSIDNSNMDKAKANKKMFGLPPVTALHGSLIFKAKSMATTIQNLKNVYVQLEPSLSHKGSLNHIKEGVPFEKREFIVRNSYEGDNDTIKHFLNNVEIFPTLKEYKEFGTVTTAMKDTDILKNIRGHLIGNLTKNSRNVLTNVITSFHDRPFLISATIQGTVSIWDVKCIVQGLQFDPNITHDCQSPITDIVMIPGYDTFAITLKDGSVLAMRVSYSAIDGKRKYTHLQPIRKMNINAKLPDTSIEDYITKIKTFITDDKSLLIGLTSLSNILLIDLRYMEIINTIQNPMSHGAITSFTIDEESYTLILGTTKGIVDVWDLRFKILINSWAFGDNIPILDIHICPYLSKNCVLVMGGSSEAPITIWNFAKIQCRNAIIFSDKQPSADVFSPLKKKLCDIQYSAVHKQRVSAVYVNGHTALVADQETSDLFMVDLKSLSKSRVLINSSHMNYSFATVQATANMSFLLIKNVSSGVNQLAKAQNNNINTLTAARVDDKSVIFAADSVGMIKIFE
ncbi:hypothetical protein KAFR_0G01670 [Kazachstania africana CBS 2517]|uniref:non-specific serine/threonine protein kinase n=1 Tax=Kazachstania africana (strain ATCC 22294 / BCRC 22015 / CBS 2517 / CECT 1963 / NBRC 1671 / NRRL Y-8276) TaxID=1071382 RepID=H2AXV1_KAZAF|nr:hypothetical protein KAFR_0G01670 [Kazachstania africana CBS 2517]CCF59201.1 hypothetical protein KAFR_0G01670 [Kazachstania africana CBS 2517]